MPDTKSIEAKKQAKSQLRSIRRKLARNNASKTPLSATGSSVATTKKLPIAAVSIEKSSSTNPFYIPLSSSSSILLSHKSKKTPTISDESDEKSIPPIKSSKLSKFPIPLPPFIPSLSKPTLVEYKFNIFPDLQITSIISDEYLNNPKLLDTKKFTSSETKNTSFSIPKTELSEREIDLANKRYENLSKSPQISSLKNLDAVNKKSKEHYAKICYVKFSLEKLTQEFSWYDNAEIDDDNLRKQFTIDEFKAFLAEKNYSDDLKEIINSVNSYLDLKNALLKIKSLKKFQQRICEHFSHKKMQWVHNIEDIEENQKKKFKKELVEFRTKQYNSSLNPSALGYYPVNQDKYQSPLDVSKIPLENRISDMIIIYNMLDKLNKNSKNESSEKEFPKAIKSALLLAGILKKGGNACSIFDELIRLKNKNDIPGYATFIKEKLDLYHTIINKNLNNLGKTEDQFVSNNSFHEKNLEKFNTYLKGIQDFTDQFKINCIYELILRQYLLGQVKTSEIRDELLKQFSNKPSIKNQAATFFDIIEKGINKPNMSADEKMQFLEKKRAEYQVATNKLREDAAKAGVGIDFEKETEQAATILRKAKNKSHISADVNVAKNIMIAITVLEYLKLDFQAIQSEDDPLKKNVALKDFSVQADNFRKRLLQNKIIVPFDSFELLLRDMSNFKTAEELDNIFNLKLDDYYNPTKGKDYKSKFEEVKSFFGSRLGREMHQHGFSTTYHKSIKAIADNKNGEIDNLIISTLKYDFPSTPFVQAVDNSKKIIAKKFENFLSKTTFRDITI